MRTTFGLGFVIALVGCGGGDDNAKPSVSTSKDNVCDQIADVVCYDLYQCCSEGEIERDLGVSDPRTVDQCHDDLRRLCNRSYAKFEDSLIASRVTFDASAMNACLQALIPPDNECATIDTALPWLEPCADSPWVGAVADGGTCFNAFECAGTGPGTSFCAPSQTCKALPAAGQPCSQGCAAGNFCNGSTCAPLQPVGGTCTTTTQCMKALFCDTSSGVGPGQCKALHKGGESCTSSQSCDSMQCLTGTCTGTGNSCFTTAQCNGSCSAGPLLGGFCSTDTNCEGHCSITTTQTCFSATGCPTTPTAETCVFYTCNHPTCAGDIVCASRQVTADYCTGPTSQLGI